VASLVIFRFTREAEGQKYYSYKNLRECRNWQRSGVIKLCSITMSLTYLMYGRRLYHLILTYSLLYILATLLIY